MNWGNKIAIVFGVFIVLIVTLVTICMRQKDIHLVAENYYEKEIAYQDQIDIERNTASLGEVPLIVYTQKNDVVTVKYPAGFKEAGIRGSMLFFRPSDANQDFTVALNTANDEQIVPVADLEKGFWKIKMEWTAADRKYYIEEKLIVL